MAGPNLSCVKQWKEYCPRKFNGAPTKKDLLLLGEILWLRGSLAHLLEINYNQLPFLDRAKTKKLIDEFKAGNNKFASLVWRIATLNHWMKNQI